ncbi:MAG: DNA polymerase III subunit gamma/tau [Terriglobales bacterium]
MPPVIARRYRPQSFDEVIGQEAIVRTLRNAITSGRVAHGYIFSGHRGIGKTTVARILAKALNCRSGQGPTPSPCQQCVSCTEIRDGNAVDVIEIDAASNRGIDEIRALRERVRYRPARDRYKFFILDEAHQLTSDAFNALLKTLEEPPEWAVFVLATTEPEALPPTIRSRCQHFGFRAVNFPVLRARLEEICSAESVATEPEALDLIAEAGEGSVRDALSLLEQAITYGQDGMTAGAVRELLGRVAGGQIRALLEPLRASQARGLMEQADALLASGVGPAQVCAQLTQSIRNALVAQAAPDAPELIAAGEGERALARELAGWFREEELARFLQILLRCAADLRHGMQQRLHFEMALVKMLHARKLSGVEDVLAALASGAPTPIPPPHPEAAPPAPTRASAGGDPTTVVRALLEQQGKASLLAILDSAAWRWSSGEGKPHLQLVFPSHDGHAVLAGQAATRKALAAACVTALGAAPEIEVTAEAGAAGTASAAAGSNPAPPLPGSPEERAEQHPLLRQLRQQVPMHVLRTRALPPSTGREAAGDR